MKLKYLLLLLSLSILMPAVAQHRSRRVFFHRHSKNDIAVIADAYVDSLKVYKAKEDSIYNDSTDYFKGRFYKLFAPLTYYYKPISNALALDSLDSVNDVSAAVDNVDKSLLNIYLKRPDLVVNSERQIRKSGGILDKAVKEPFVPQLSFFEKEAPKPDEPMDVPMGVIVKRPNFWTWKGDYYLQFIQNYVSDNWYKGGENSYSMVASATIQANYNNKSKVKFENTLEMKLGFQTSESDTLHKFKTNNDMIRYTGKLGLQASKKWYYTFQLLTYTQFTQGLKSNDKKVYSDFMSPWNLNVSVGMDYTVATKKNKLTGTVHIAPLAYNFRYVSRLDLATRYGLPSDAHHSMNDFGSETTINLTWKMNDLISWQTRLYGYTTYKRVEMEWENTITFAFSKLISSKIFIYPRFDDGATRDPKHGYWQFKEYASLGLSLSY